MRKRYLIAGVVVALALPLGGCGDDDDGSASATDEELIARADFIQAADAACEKRNEEMTQRAQRVVAKYSGEPDSPKARRAVIEEAIAPGFEGEIKDLQALEPPADKEEEIEEFITALEEMVARTREDLAEGRNYPYRKTENLGAAAGLPDCGTPGT